MVDALSRKIRIWSNTLWAFRHILPRRTLRGINMKQLIALLFVAACATEYQPMSITGGYKEEEIAPNQWHVTFRGNGYTSPIVVREYAKRRAGEICQARGFNSYSIDSEAQPRSVASTTCNDNFGRLNCSTDEREIARAELIATCIKK